MKLLPIFTLAASLGLLALRPSPARAQAELPYTLTQGSYAGSFVRVAASEAGGDEVGPPERGQVGLELTPAGLVFGFFGAVPRADGSFGPYFVFRGQIDPASRRGFIKVLASNGVGGSPVTAVGAEKIPIFLYLDGRLVGGGLDPQGGSIALRATFQPLTRLPVPPPTP